MKHTVVETKLAPTPGNYSQGRIIEFDDYKVLYTSGQTGNDPVSGELSENIKEQVERTLLNIKGIIEEAGGTIDDIVKATVYIKDMKNNKPGFEEAYKAFFPFVKPVRSTVEVVEIPLVNENTLVEIDIVAYIQRNT